MQIGSTKRLIKSGTACARIACLSAIDDELSIMNKRSIFDTLFSLMGVSKYEGGTAASVARQLPLELAPCELHATMHAPNRTKSTEVCLFTVDLRYRSFDRVAKQAT